MNQGEVIEAKAELQLRCPCRLDPIVQPLDYLSINFDAVLAHLDKFDQSKDLNQFSGKLLEVYQEVDLKDEAECCHENRGCVCEWTKKKIRFSGASAALLIEGQPSSDKL